MRNEKRHDPRRGIRHTAWIGLQDGKVQGCVLADISNAGARLVVENGEALPDQFVLLLSRRGTPSRKCKVVWRNESEIGVQFDLAVARTDKVRKVFAPPLMPDDADGDTAGNEQPAETAQAAGKPEQTE